LFKSFLVCVAQVCKRQPITEKSFGSLLSVMIGQPVNVVATAKHNISCHLIGFEGNSWNNLGRAESYSSYQKTYEQVFYYIFKRGDCIEIQTSVDLFNVTAHDCSIAKEPFHLGACELQVVEMTYEITCKINRWSGHFSLVREST